MSFFKSMELPVLKDSVSTLPACGACGFYKTCKSPKIEPQGKGKKRILIISDMPGANEDENGKPIVGEAEKLLSSALRKYGVELSRDCVVTNSIICRPRLLMKEEAIKKSIGYCRPNLIQTIKKHKPEIIIPLGGFAANSLLAWTWGDKEIGAIDKWAGYQIPDKKTNAWICPNYHPSEVNQARYNSVLGVLFDKFLQGALSLKGRPYETVPTMKNLESKIEVIFDTDEATRVIRKMSRTRGVYAFDYETNMLKPDSKDSEIVCCSICQNGKRTIAFLWNEKVRKAMKRFLENPKVKKIASNMKFEDRWSRCVTKAEVRGWIHDTMLAAHALENASKSKKITGLKFQSYAHLGIEDYDSAIKPYLKGEGTYTKNRIHKSDKRKLLLYNGLDSLFEYQLAVKQAKLFGMTLEDMEIVSC